MDKLSGYDWGSMLKSVTNKVKQYTLNLSVLELKVEDATSNETWGPHGSVMNEIAEASFDFESYKQIMGVIARRLQEKEENWRMCYKALLLLEYLVKHGPMKVVHDISGSAAVLDRLTNFDYKDPNGKDHGVNVRHRAKELLQLINNPDRVREERQKAKANKAKYTGVSAAEMRSGGFGSSNSGFGNGGGSTSFRSGPSTQRMYSSSGAGGGGGGSGLGGGLSSSRGSGFGSSGSGGVLGGGGHSSSFSRGGRVSQEDVEEDYHYISKRATGSEEGESDPVAATRARIDALKVSGKADNDEKAAAEGEQRKKLADVKVNPKIAASLGLKFAAPTPAVAAPASQPAAAPAAASNQVNLLGGLTDDPAPAAASTSATDFFDALAAPAATTAAAAPANGGGWDAFAGLAAPTAAVEPKAAAGAGGWDAFGGTSMAPAAPAAAGAGSAAMDLFGGLEAPAPASSAPAFDPFATTAAPKAAPQAAPAAAFDPFAQPSATGPAGSTGVAASKSAFDPFADFAAGPGAPSSAVDPLSATAAPATAPATAAARTAAAAGKAPSLGRPLPEDMFSDLTGLNKEAKPMGSRKGLHMDLPPFPAAPQPSAAPPTAGPGFPAAGFAGAPAAGPGPRGPVVLDPRTGQPVMLVPVPVGHGQPVGLGSFPLPGQQPQKQQGGLSGYGQQPDLSGGLLGVGGGSLGGGSMSSGAAPPVKLGASPKKDPFADLLG
ncbi:hypothetical protein N2152v2_004422 [Parachlorella kessleri]